MPTPTTAPKTPTYTPEEQARIDAITADWKKQLTPQETQESLDAIDRMAPGTVTNGVVQPCPKKAKKLDCVSPTDKMAFDDSLKNAVKTNVAAKYQDPKPDIDIDYDQINNWEKNYGGGYVPWGPQINSETRNIGTAAQPDNVQILVPSTDHDASGSLQGWKVGKYFNSSGVTVGAGYDMGGKTADGIKDSMNNAAKDSGLLDPAGAKALGDKLAPYAGLKRTDACQKLRTTPLSLSQSETDVVNYASLSTNTESAIDQYESKSGQSWNDLSSQEQTVVMSKVYQTGSISKPLATAIGDGDSATVLKSLQGSREHDYMQSYYNSLGGH